MSKISQELPRSPRFRLLIVSLLAVWSSLPALSVRAEPSYALFESGQVRPLALSPNRELLFAVNTPDNRLEIFRFASSGALVHVQSVPVGLEPVAVAARSNQEVWVVNHLSDSVSIVGIPPQPDHARVMRTLLVGDEPRDIVFAGPGKNRAFISAAHRGQNVPFDPALTTPGVGRADVWVYDAGQLSDVLTGGPLAILSFFADTPRALATNAEGTRVYVAGLSTGNRTAVAAEFTSPPLPPPTTNFQGLPQPRVGLIVKFDGTHWVDELNRSFDSLVLFDLPDKDVFAIDAMASPPAAVAGAGGTFSGVGTVIYNMAVNPVSGKVYVSNTEALNQNRFEGPGTFAGHTVRGHHNENRITVLGTDGSVQPRHLNKHLDFASCCTAPPNIESALSLALPTQVAVTANGQKLLVAAMGSSKIGIFSTQALENDSFVPSAEHQIPVSGGGPTGILLDEPRQRFYVLTRFDNSISVVDIPSRSEIAHVALFNPEPPSIVNGRRFLYDATLSAKGDSACASCHVFGDKDELAWDLGNPDEEFLPNNNPFRINLSPNPVDPSFPPMKGPLTTQSLRGMANHGPMHWRGDRTGSLFEPNIQPDSGAYNEREAFRQFQAGFVGLIGRPDPLPVAQMEQFTDFILQLMYPPNPNRALDNALTPDQQTGRDFFFGPISDSNVISCEGCHRTDPDGNRQYGVERPGFFGTDGQQAREVFQQVFKIPHFRNLYTKVGMFGMVNLHPGIEAIPGLMGHLGPQIRGFGFSRAGDVDSVFRFLHATSFSTGFLFGPNPGGFPAGPAGDPLRRKVEQFLLAFDTNLKPIVGQQITLAEASGAAVNARIDLLLARADAGDCELVAKGSLNQAHRGFLYLGNGSFRSDRAELGIVSTSALRAAVDQQAERLTFTCVPPGTGLRIGIDRDEDGVLDGDDPLVD